MTSAGIAIICKTPEAGKSKTRLSPPLAPEQCAAISECFIRDLTANIQRLCDRRGLSGYAIYAPIGSETRLRPMLPQAFGLIPQCDGDLGARLLAGMQAMLSRGHRAAFILNADSPTLPMDDLEAAIDRCLAADLVALGPAMDGGYTFIGLSRARARLFENISWSTDVVHRTTLERAAELGLPAYDAPLWYDVDDAQTLAILQDEIDGVPPAFARAGHRLADAPATRRFLQTLGRRAPNHPAVASA